MSDSTNSEHSVNTGGREYTAFVWGADEIGRVIGRNGRQTHHLLTNGEIKSAKKVGGRWVANRLALLREMGAVHG